MSLVDWLQAEPAVALAAAFAVGLVVGSFLNVVIHRLPEMMQRQWAAECAQMQGRLLEQPRYDLAWPPSHCPRCHTPVAAYHNVPILSWLWLRGRCAACATRIAVRYPLVELAGGLLAAAVVARFGVTPAGAMALLLAWALLALAAIDLDTQLLPDAITLPLLWLGLAANLAGLFTGIVEAVVGAMAGYLVLWLVYHGFRLATGKEGMGYGDFKLLAALGAWLGWRELPSIVLLSALAGSVVGIALILARRHGRSVPMPFGPYLALAGWIAMFGGSPIALLPQAGVVP
ncbi:MAG: A24 family peptidase [Gammaproteobacteria bacterium]